MPHVSLQSPRNQNAARAVPPLLCVIALTKKAPCPVRTTEPFEVKGNPLSSMHVYGACLALRHLEEWAFGRDSAAASVRHVQVDILVWHGSAVSLCDLEPV